MNRILRVNTRTGAIESRLCTREEMTWGGRSFIVHHMLEGVDPACDALGTKNKLILTNGLLGDTSVTTAGRASIGGKSPLTGGIKESNVGGSIGKKLAGIGFKAIVLEDAPVNKQCKILLVKHDKAELIDTPHLEGLETGETIKVLDEKYGEKTGVLCIGPAGEFKLSAALIVTPDHTRRQLRTAGRGGLGAVMGSKGIKAIVIDDTGSIPVKAVDEESLRAAAREVAKIIMADPKTENRHNFGTPAVLSTCNALGILPTRNFSSGSFEQAAEISGERIAELIVERGGEGEKGLPCVTGCIIACSNIFPDPSGKAHVASLQYENIALLGSNLGIGDIDEIAILNNICNQVGIDAIDGGAAIGVAMESGLLEFGDSEGAKELLRQVGEGTPLGRVIGSGVVVAGRVFGISRVPATKGQAMPAYDPRALKGIGVTYAISPMGADHTAGNMLETAKYIDPLSPDGQIEMSYRLQVRGAILDSLGVCLFLRPAFVKNPNLIPRLLNARYGWDLVFKDIQNMGTECLKAEEEFNTRAGIDKTRCDIPEFMRSEPLPPHNTVFDISRETMNAIWSTKLPEDVF
jgi:aldehyde:ferredoxin oxidoreductase